MPRIQIITIILSILLLLFIARLIIKGRLREEYAIVWIFSTLFLVIFSFWREGFETISHFLQVYDPPNLIFTAAIAAILIYLLHLSVVVSKLQDQNKRLTQELANMRARQQSSEKENAA
jgi:hypothetical protein